MLRSIGRRMCVRTKRPARLRGTQNRSLLGAGSSNAAELRSRSALMLASCVYSAVARYLHYRSAAAAGAGGVPSLLR